MREMHSGTLISNDTSRGSSLQDDEMFTGTCGMMGGTCAIGGPGIGVAGGAGPPGGAVDELFARNPPEGVE